MASRTLALCIVFLLLGGLVSAFAIVNVYRVDLLSPPVDEPRVLVQSMDMANADGHILSLPPGTTVKIVSEYVDEQTIVVEIVTNLATAETMSQPFNGDPTYWPDAP